MAIQTDIFIMGAGPAGYRAAELAAKRGLKVVVAEANQVGGTCLNVGCIPTKTYVHSASFEEARQRMPQVVEQLRSGVEAILAHPNITLVRGRASFLDAHTVQVQPLAAQNDGATEFVAEHIIIATGSVTKLLPLPDADDPRVVDSTGMLQLNSLPRKLCIIGAGVIGMEFASVFHRFGSEVAVVEYLKECLPALDSDIAKRLRKTLEKRGIGFRMKTAVQQLADIDADVILMATGRKPCVQDHFAKAGFDYDERQGIAVDQNFETTVEGIYAIGDVNGRQLLAHAAEMQAVRAVNHIMGIADRIDFSIMPAAIFTQPEAACVGLSEDQLKANGVIYECRKAFHRANGRALSMGQADGMVKLLSEPFAGRIVGCHAFGAHSADLVQEASVLMCRETTVDQLSEMVHIHPTLGELLLSAAEA